MTTADKLRAAKALIEDPAHWCQGHYALNADGADISAGDPRAVKWCAIGACNHLGMTDKTTDYLYRSSGSPVTLINDLEGHAAVLALFDRAIELAFAEEARDG